MIESKAWNWEIGDREYWRNVSDEFLPVGLRWKERGFKTFLDLGCGLGRHSLLMAGLGFEVSAFDLAEDGLAKLAEEADRQGLDIDMTRGDMLTLPYDDSFFDCVLAFHSMYHTDKMGLIRVISEIGRILKPGGEIYITLNSKESDTWKLFSDRRIDGYTLLRTEGPEIDVPHTFLDYEDVPVLLAGFEILKIQQIFDYMDDRKHAHFFINCKK